jgi:hypothetical protein
MVKSLKTVIFILSLISVCFSCLVSYLLCLVKFHYMLVSLCLLYLHLCIAEVRKLAYCMKCTLPAEPVAWKLSQWQLKWFHNLQKSHLRKETEQCRNIFQNIVEVYMSFIAACHTDIFVTGHYHFYC